MTILKNNADVTENGRLMSEEIPWLAQICLDWQYPKQCVVTNYPDSLRRSFLEIYRELECVVGGKENLVSPALPCLPWRIYGVCQ